VVISPQLEEKLPLSLRSPDGPKNALMFLVGGLLCFAVPIMFVLDLQKHLALSNAIATVFVSIFVWASGTMSFTFAIIRWWERNHDGYVMIITKVVPPGMAHFEPRPGYKWYYSVTYKRVSEFKHTPITAYEGALLVALNPKQRDVHFENLRMAGCLPVFQDGRFTASFGGCEFYCDSIEGIWELMKENEYARNMHSSTDILRWFREFVGQSNGLARLLLTIEERLADKKTFGRAAGALDLRWTILKSIKMRNCMPESLRGRYEERVKEYNSAQEKRDAQKKGTKGVFPYQIQDGASEGSAEANAAVVRECLEGFE